MEPMEDEGQVCRLCGQVESIYIDIFGEEGNRRFLGFKIHSKINILIKPDDGLPHVICMRCLGTLEFLCDFHSKCHDAQKDFQSIAKIKNSEQTSKEKLESDEESDKENVLPAKSGKTKAKSHEKADAKLAKNEECEENMVLQTLEISNELIVKTNSSLVADDLQIRNKCLDSIRESTEILQKNSESLQEHSLEKISQKIIENVIINEGNSIKSRENMSEILQDKLNILSGNSVVVENIGEITQDNTATDNKTNNQFIKNETIQDLVPVVNSIEFHNVSNMHNSVTEVISSNIDTKRDSCPLLTHQKNVGMKLKRCSKPSPLVRGKNKKDIYQRCKTIDKYFTEMSQYKEINTNEENVNLDYTKAISYTKMDEIDEQNNVIFEGTVINTSGDTAIIMPLKTATFQDELRLENIVMANDSEIVQAEEIVWIANNSQLFEPEKPKSINSSQCKTTSPAPGDEAEPVSVDETLILQASGQEENIKNPKDQLIILEVQLPAKENSVLPNYTAALKRKSVESRYSEGKIAKISELMTEKQKNEIETHYSIDMRLVDELKVNENVIVFDKSKYQCKICETIYPRLDKCQVHIWRHLDMKPYLCKVCDFSTLTVSNIRCHIRKSHLKIKPFECHLCKKCYNSATLLEEHLNIHSGARPYECNHCQFASTSKQVLAHHILIHKSKKDIICDTCGKAFYSKGRMRAHQITHNKEQAFKCALCSTYVLHQEALERHYMNVHAKDYICKICNKAYKSRKALHNHESVHSDAKFKCPMCPNKYKSTHILKEHILKHQGIRQYKCNSCDKSFAQQSHLAAHMAVHSNIMYDCPGCNKGFNRHDNMKVHTKRCDKFLANPELQTLLTKRKISCSKNHTAKANIQNEDNIIKKKKAYKKSNNRSKIFENSIKHIESNNISSAIESILQS